MSKTFAERFWAKVNKTDFCWLWTGCCFSNGYGMFRTGGTVGRRKLLTHRVAYALVKGEVPEGLNVLHRCDIRNCVNPMHLFLGSAADNAADCTAKHRQGNHAPKHPSRGIRHPMARFTEREVIEIRTLYAAGGIGQAQLGSQFGVGQSTIHKIVSGARWRHISVLDNGLRTNMAYRPAIGERHGRHKLTLIQAIAIRKELGTHQLIANRFGVSRTTVSLIKSGRLWTKAIQAHVDILPPPPCDAQI